MISTWKTVSCALLAGGIMTMALVVFELTNLAWLVLALTWIEVMFQIAEIKRYD